MDVTLIPKILLFCIGLFSVAWWPGIPSINYLPLLWTSLAVIIFIPRFRAISCLATGVLFAAWYGQNLVGAQLPVEYDRIQTTVTGRVVGLPEIQNKKIRFQFIVDKFEESTLNSEASKGSLPEFAKHGYLAEPQRILLSWYFPQAEPFRNLKPGQKLTLIVRLRRPRGTLNPGGFDYQLWLLRQGITATGYVRSFIKAEPEANSGIHNYLRSAPDHFRYRIVQEIDKLELPPQSRALLVALTVGSKHRISTDDWKAYARSGVIHLLVISGLHIGFASLFGYGLGAGIARIINLSGDRVISQRWGCLTALFTAGLYAMLAGWSIPTQRALVMVAVFALGRFSARHFSSGFGFFLALFFVALLDPLAVQDRGFWLSFIAVAVLLWILRGNDLKQESLSGKNKSYTDRLVSGLQALWKMFRVQVVICLVISVFLQLFNLPFSWVAPLVNMLAVPWISFLVVPLCLAAILILPLLPDISSLLLQLAALLLGWFHGSVVWVSQLPVPDSHSIFPAGVLVSVCLVVAGLLIVLPLGALTRIPGLLLLVAVVYARPEKPDLRVTVLDVGQGLSVVVETPQQSLVYDSGPVFSEKLDAGGAIVAPYLTSRGIHRVDKLIISHDDSDHAGGVPGLLNTIAVDEIIADHKPQSGAAFTSAAGAIIGECEHDRHWRWQGVTFTLINPRVVAPNARSNDNNESCMLLLEYAGQRILLPGDIEGPVELPLIHYLTGNLPLDVLVAPHHGSKTSSTARFVTALSPLHVVFSAGFNHHFGHPHTRVVNRYREQFAQLHNTAETGAIQFVWHGNELQVTEYRDQVRRYWR